MIIPIDIEDRTLAYGAIGMCELIKFHADSLVEGQGDREVFPAADAAEHAFLETHF
jgi:hypothetical protein